MATFPNIPPLPTPSALTASHFERILLLDGLAIASFHRVGRAKALEAQQRQAGIESLPSYPACRCDPNPSSEPSLLQTSGPAATTGAAGVLAAACVVTLVLTLKAFHYELPEDAQAAYMAALTYGFGTWLHDGPATASVQTTLVAAEETPVEVSPAPAAAAENPHAISLPEAKPGQPISAIWRDSSTNSTLKDPQV